MVDLKLMLQNVIVIYLLLKDVVKHPIFYCTKEIILSLLRVYNIVIK
jgi:hypothetical protein